MTTNTTPSREEMINAIYDKIADKTLSFWCIVVIKDISFVVDEWEDWSREIPADIYFNYWDEDNLYIRNVIFSNDFYDEEEEIKYSDVYNFEYLDESDIEENQRYFYFGEKLEGNEIIWHPIMIGDIYDFFEKNNFTKYKRTLWINGNNVNFDKSLAMLWTEKRKPIEEQDNDCVEFVYNLISK